MKKAMWAAFLKAAVVALSATAGRAEPMTYYLYLTDVERTIYNEIIWFWTPDTLDGPVRSNDYIGLKYSPQFYGPIYTSQREFRYYQPGNIYFGYPPRCNVPPYRFPAEFNYLRMAATTRINDGGGRLMTRIRFRGFGGIDISQYQLGAHPVDSLMINLGTAGRQVIFVNGQVELEGEVAQQVTVAASGNIWLLDDLYYRGADRRSAYFNEEEMEYMLGVVSERNIIIADNRCNGMANGADEAPNDFNRHSIVLNGSYVALGESFTFQHQNDDWDYYQGPTPDERGGVYLKGGIAQKRRGYVHRSNHFGTGYAKSWHYDNRLLRIGPPGFGPGEYQDLHGEYDRLLLLPAVYDIQNARVGRLTILPGATIRLHGADALSITDSLVAVGTEENPIAFQAVNGGGAVRSFSGTAVAIIEHAQFAEDVEFTFAGAEAVVRSSTFGGEATIEGELKIDSCSFAGPVSATGMGRSKISRSLFRRGLSLSGVSRSFDVLNNTIVNSRGAGVRLRAGRNFSIVNNIIASNRWGIQNESGDELELRYNDVWGSDRDDYLDCRPGEGSISADPRFVNVRRDDYRLSYGSPCIDAGDPDSPCDPDRTRADMGAYYFDRILEVKGDDFGLRIADFGVSAAPNPFNSATEIIFEIKSAGEVRLSVSDAAGREISEVFHGWSGAGKKAMRWGVGEPSGVYIIRLEAAGKSSCVKVVKIG